MNMADQKRWVSVRVMVLPPLPVPPPPADKWPPPEPHNFDVFATRDDACRVAVLHAASTLPGRAMSARVVG